MGSLPDSKYIIKTDGYWFVEAHDIDPSKGYISVSAKGIVNGLSNQPNDGCDFGPDSYVPNSTASIPYTQTSGIGEALQYGNANNKKVFIKNGTYNWNDELQNYVPNNGIIMIEGETKEGVQINLLNNHWFTDNAVEPFANTRIFFIT